jgi:hypothetical protein
VVLVPRLNPERISDKEGIKISFSLQSKLQFLQWLSLEGMI